MKTLRPFFILFVLILSIGLACSATGGGSSPAAPTEAPEQPVAEVPTEEPATEAPAAEPTAEPAPTEEPATEAPAANAEFFTEEFDQDPGEAWFFDVWGPNSENNADKATYAFDRGLMEFDITAKNLYAYYFYDGQSYDNVRVDIHFENRGVNSQAVSLVCRASDEGFYQFLVGSDGLWAFYVYTPDEGYVFLQNGASKAVKQGKAVNEYGMTCDGEKIGLFINGTEIRNSPFTERRYALREGSVGFNVQSFDVIPVKVEVDWFQISQP